MTDHTPFLLTIEDKHWIDERGAAIVGYVERGSVQKGDLVEIMATPEPIKTAVTLVERYSETDVIAREGELVALLMDALTREQWEGLEQGSVIAEPESVGMHTTFTADLTIRTQAEGGREFGLDATASALAFYVFGVQRMVRRIDFESSSGRLFPGETARVTLQTFPAPLEAGQPFQLREGARWIAQGTIVEVLD